ncbi:metallophosphoesterase family protein [Bradyrhizobium guangxiense]|uniref:metallophosphoesterase family protein n=1 Tax=Bradyrhizobium guangxiense TaxID=1325115 RepID=UPI001009165E|nr:metallophosphoesterase family protein [Bradyrhizobium guangxiense]
MMPLFRSRPPKRKPTLPDGVRIYAISDIHGCTLLLEPMLRVIDADLARSKPRHAIEVFLGDYIDRGPDARSTLDVLVKRSRRANTVFLKGNHEALLATALRSPDLLDDWLRVGGAQTLTSYGVSLSHPTPEQEERVALLRQFARVLPPDHVEFLRNLRPSFTCGDFFFVHAGIRPGVPLSEQRETDLLWIREEFLQSDERFSKYIVHGHTPVRNAQLLSNRANIDTGAYATGNLTLMSIQGTSMLAV